MKVKSIQHYDLPSVRSPCLTAVKQCWNCAKHLYFDWEADIMWLPQTDGGAETVNNSFHKYFPYVIIFLLFSLYYLYSIINWGERPWWHYCGFFEGYKVAYIFLCLFSQLIVIFQNVHKMYFFIDFFDYIFTISE